MVKIHEFKKFKEKKDTKLMISNNDKYKIVLKN